MVAAVTDRTVTELEPLARVVDADAVAALLPPRRWEDDERRVEVSFSFEGFRVEIEAGGTVTLRAEPEEAG